MKYIVALNYADYQHAVALSGLIDQQEVRFLSNASAEGLLISPEDVIWAKCWQLRPDACELLYTIIRLNLDTQQHLQFQAQLQKDLLNAVTALGALSQNKSLLPKLRNLIDGTLGELESQIRKEKP